MIHYPYISLSLKHGDPSGLPNLHNPRITRPAMAPIVISQLYYQQFILFIDYELQLSLVPVVKIARLDLCDPSSNLGWCDNYILFLISIEPKSK